MKCKNCNQEVESISSRRKWCKSCTREYNRTYKAKRIQENPEYLEQLKKASRENYYKDREIYLERGKKWREENKEYLKEYQKLYFQENKDKRWQYWKEKRKTDLEYRITSNLRTRIWNAVNEYRYKKKNSTLAELGCSIQEYFVYLEKQFDEHMSWDNYGTYWEIDHIIPLAKEGSFHYTNTQPMEITENRIKGSKIF